MIIYKCIITGDEMISDAYDLKEVDNIVYEVNGANKTIGNENIDIGANPSAEEAPEDVDDTTETVINVVHDFRLNETSKYDKKGFLSILKKYMKTVKEAMQAKGASEDEVKAFEKGAAGYVKEKLLPNINNFDFYIGESFNQDGMVVLKDYREDGLTPYFIFWKHGLTEMKV